MKIIPHICIGISISGFITLIAESAIATNDRTQVERRSEPSTESATARHAETSIKEKEDDIDILYQPPLAGVPGNREAAATRTEHAAYQISVLTPANHVGQTLVPQPILYWYSEKPIQEPIKLTIVNDRPTSSSDLEPLLKTQLSTPIAAGIHAIALHDYKVTLQPNIVYKWSISVGGKRSHTVTSGNIRYVKPVSSTVEQIEKLAPGAKISIFSKHGYWYDLLAELSRLIEKEPHNGAWHARRIRLLEQVQLADVAKHEKKNTSPGH